MGNFELAASSSGGSGSYTFLIVIVVLFGLLYFVMIRPQRNKQRRVQQMQQQVQPGSRVRTTAGMYATVIDADDQDVLLEVAPGVQIRFLRRAIMDTVPDDDGTVSSPDGEHAAADSATDGPSRPAPTPAVSRPRPRRPVPTASWAPSTRTVPPRPMARRAARPPGARLRTSAPRTDRQPRAGPRGGGQAT